MRKIARRDLLAGIGMMGAAAALLVSPAPAQADQPHMHAALDALRTARHELEAADADKGGHRAKALRFVQDAIAQVERGIQFDRHH
jgi:hypothetical protein